MKIKAGPFLRLKLAHMGYKPRRASRWSVDGDIPTQSVTAIKLSRHSGMDRRNPDCGDATNPYHPWSLGSGDPCRNDALFLNLMAVTLCVGMQFLTLLRRKPLSAEHMKMRYHAERGNAFPNV